MRLGIVIASLVAFTSYEAHAQVAAPVPMFEVASVRPSKPGIRGSSMEFSKGGERFTATNMPFGAFLLVAYDVTVRQLSGPGEFLSDKYDVAAKAEHAVSPEEMLKMLQALLADRFKLVVRREIREVPVYALTVRKGGTKLRQSPADSEAATPRTPARAIGAELKSGHFVFKNESMADFAWALTRMAGIGDRVVVDNTGLKGNFDFELSFTRERTLPAGADVRELVRTLEDPSIFSALQEQLGLRLESKKAPVEFLIIEHVEKPSEN